MTGSKAILDFGSGLGITANHLARNNEVVAVEPNQDMLEIRLAENSYRQLAGGVDQIRKMKSEIFDVVLCHNVLEYVKERRDIFAEFCRLLKPGGIISIVKHNRAGKIMAKAVFENNIDEAITLLDGGTTGAAYFGNIDCYDTDDIKGWIGNRSIVIERVLGIRSFFGLQQNNEIKFEPQWQEKMFELETKASAIKDFVNIAFLNHIILRKNG